ncbi:hypothetical protein SAMN04487974_102117 [Pelagibacterium luteolum]|uniref:Uncharacterized protein n=1 Tax=Pelagibacterium luteolum TaxID=440168 RepID=A0A1G7TIR1_9HYPH|nr:hypothetical protein SAMN04487974_102117 [Pelagibacterium luteolum]
MAGDLVCLCKLGVRAKYSALAVRDNASICAACVLELSERRIAGLESALGKSRAGQQYRCYNDD